MDKEHALTAFAALGQSTRIDVFRLLIKAGGAGMVAGEIGAALATKQNTMSANLAILLQAGLVRNQREGQRIRYFAKMEGVRGLLGFLMQDCCGGQTELCQPIIDEVAISC